MLISKEKMIATYYPSYNLPAIAWNNQTNEEIETNNA